MRALTLKDSLREVHFRTASSMSSQREHDFLMAKQKREEAEKQEQAAMHLAKQKHEIAMGKKALEI